MFRYKLKEFIDSLELKNNESIGYKVCYNEDEGFRSCFVSDYNALHYKIGQTVVPSIGKIFCYKDVDEATLFAYQFNNEIKTCLISIVTNPIEIIYRPNSFESKAIPVFWKHFDKLLPILQYKYSGLWNLDIDDLRFVVDYSEIQYRNDYTILVDSCKPVGIIKSDGINYYVSSPIEINGGINVSNK